MNASARRREIADLVRTAGQVVAADLSARFAVNAETIRRDLSVLEASGDLRRVHGGAIARTALAVEGKVSNRIAERRDEKLAIARVAAAEIPPFGTIFIEAGSTTGHLAQLLPDRGDLLIVTNALQIALELTDLGRSTVMTIGGRVRPASYAEVDTWALERLAGLRFDVAFVGANAIDLAWGLSTPDPAEAAVKAAILASAQKAVLMTDHTKFGLQAACRYGAIEDIDLVVTDRGIDPATIDELHGLGLKVRLADD
ncbi:DeoR/GlpR family DNA-binding transcription regulator [Dactylosporangium fulvum]|uniref:Lactose phosphotransferase system repressor n=1 Tax=Dactylosporangium fulvum TaxID=53359 RepID=A0ABY5W9X2_9ACTN|nr:DeoR/GlpR family DNA-binding transcription regulator [Dactylosporangium fulvum]UWP86872.1 DeoR/GlpR family DNA-binding transcription regulator [Dactylosporangium fulvum]